MTLTINDRRYDMQTLPLRRSPLYRLHQSNGAEFVERSGSAVVSHYDADSKAEFAQAESLAIADLSGLARIGFKGADTVAWLQSQNLSLPVEPNQACLSDDGLCVARLSRTEFLILDNLLVASEKIEQLRKACSMDQSQRSYLLERADSHACFALSGEHVPTLLSKVCGVDMRLHRFAQYRIAQTSVARVNSIVIRSDQAKTPCFYVLADLSPAEFMWQGLLDAMQEFGGKPVGLNALNSLTK